MAKKRIFLHLIENNVRNCICFSLFLFLLVSLHLPVLFTTAGVADAIPSKRQCDCAGLLLASTRFACDVSTLFYLVERKGARGLLCPSGAIGAAEVGRLQTLYTYDTPET